MRRVGRIAVLLAAALHCSADDPAEAAPAGTDGGPFAVPSLDAGLGDGAVPRDGAPLGDTGTPTRVTPGSKHFTDETTTAALDTLQTPINWAFDFAVEDFDDDGKLDLFLGDHATTGNQNRLLHNDGQLAFSNSNAPVQSVTGTWSLQAVDVDNDGDVDAIVNWDSQNSSLFINGGGGALTKSATPFEHQANGMAWADYDGDGLLDFAVTNFGATANKLWHHKTSGVTPTDFEDATTSSGMVTGRSSAAVFLADFNGDGFPDLLAQSLVGGDIFNAATGCSTKIAFNKAIKGTGAGFAAPQTAGLDTAPCFGLAVGDFDNDGDLDVVATGSAAAGNAAAGNGSVLLGMRLFRNEGKGAFADVTAAAMLPTATAPADVYRHIYDQAVWVDVDQDGFLDLVITMDARDRLFRNLGNGKFTDATSAWKLGGGGGRPERLFAGDLDADGAPDLLTQSGQATAPSYRLWRNGYTSASWLTIRLQGTKIKTAVSSRIWLYETGHIGDPAFLRGMREVITGTSHRSPLEQYFGVEAGKRYDVRVKFWPDGTTVDNFNISPGQRFRIKEDGSAAAAY